MNAIMVKLYFKVFGCNVVAECMANFYLPMMVSYCMHDIYTYSYHIELEILEGQNFQ